VEILKLVQTMLHVVEINLINLGYEKMKAYDTIKMYKINNQTWTPLCLNDYTDIGFESL
jgi:hypothetical protein